MNLDDYLKTPSPHQKALAKLFGPNEQLVIFDIGACEGEDSIRYHRMFPNAKIYSFEPLPKNIIRFKSNIKKYQAQNITLTVEALSDNEGHATFFVSSGQPEHIEASEDWDYGNKSSSLLPPEKTKEVHKWLKFKEEITVTTTTLAIIFERFGIDFVDFIHMDIQGAELMALTGAGAKISQVKSIWLEVEAKELYKDQPLQKEIEQFMTDHGFRKVMDTVGEVAGDQLYVNKAFFPSPPQSNLWQKIVKRLLPGDAAI